MSIRTGRNYRYAAGGHALTAAVMGLAGAYLSTSAIFMSSAILCVPALIAVGCIRSDEIDYAKARNAATEAHNEKIVRVFELLKNRRLVLFAAAVVLFQFADASVLPLVGEKLATSAHEHASIWMSGLILVPQIVVALLAPWVGFHSEKSGRRPLLLTGFCLEPIRVALLAVTAQYPILIVAQLLSGVTGATVGVLTVLVVADLTAGTGRFNLAVGSVGALSGVAASLSTSSTGFLFQEFGRTAGFLVLAGIAAAAAALLWAFLSETKPEQYFD
jgi:MFS family permease